VKLLGAIIAGGGSRRFGGDKAAALLNGRALIDHVADALRPQVDALIVCGRDLPGLDSVADRPTADMGPLGGLCAALHYAAQHKYDAVLTAGCDVLPVPDLRALVRPTATVVKNHWLFGYWPVALAPALDHHLATQSDRSMRHWIAVSGAREIDCDVAFHNLNTRDDFALYCATRGLTA
jgi:molybdenum cofactor guanylyltransferase